MSTKPSSPSSPARCACVRPRRAASSGAASPSQALPRASSIRGWPRCVRRPGSPGCRARSAASADAVIAGRRLGVFGDYDVDGRDHSGAPDRVPALGRGHGRGRGGAARRGLRLHRGRGGGLRGARLRGDRHRRLRHQRSRGDLGRGGAWHRRDRRRSPHRAGGRGRSSVAGSGQSAPRRLDVSVPRHGLGRPGVLRRGGRAHRAARAAVF